MKKRWLMLILPAIAVMLCACGGGEEDVTETIHTDVQEGNSQMELFSQRIRAP